VLIQHPLIDHPNKIITVGNHVNVVGIGDGVILTALAREIHKKWPDWNIKIKTKGPKWMFENTPYIKEVEHGLIGHCLDIGHGHYIERKCRTFGIESPELRGSLYFTPHELLVATKTFDILRRGDRQPIIFCQNSTDNRRNWTRDNWAALIDALSPKYDVYQVEQVIHYNRFEPGNPDDQLPNLYDTVPNARQELRNLDLRRVAALQSISKKYLGSNTGFMHIAMCFGDDNFIHMHHQYGGNDEWLYPQANNFWEDATLDAVINTMQAKWLS